MNIELRKWTMKDIYSLVNISNEVDRTYLTGSMPKPYRKEDALWFIKNAYKRDGKSGIYRSIVVNDEYVGEISIVCLDDIHSRTGNLGYYMIDAYKGMGVMSEAVKQICELAFQQLNIYRIQATTFEENFASRKVLEKNGFELEGTLKNHIFKNSTISNECIYGKSRIDL